MPNSDTTEILAAARRLIAADGYAISSTMARDVLLVAGAARRMAETLTKLNTIRDEVIRTQRAGWSTVVYPLVALLNEAGFPSTLTDEDIDGIKTTGNRLTNAVTAPATVRPGYREPRESPRDAEPTGEPPLEDRP